MLPKKNMFHAKVRIFLGDIFPSCKEKEELCLKMKGVEYLKAQFFIYRLNFRRYIKKELPVTN